MALRKLMKNQDGGNSRNLLTIYWADGETKRHGSPHEESNARPKTDPCSRRKLNIRGAYNNFNPLKDARPMEVLSESENYEFESQAVRIVGQATNGEQVFQQDSLAEGPLCDDPEDETAEVSNAREDIKPQPPKATTSAPPLPATIAEDSSVHPPKTTTSVPLLPTAAGSSMNGIINNDGSSGGSVGVGLIVGLTVAAAVAAVLICLGIIVRRRQRRKRTEDSISTEEAATTVPWEDINPELISPELKADLQKIAENKGKRLYVDPSICTIPAVNDRERSAVVDPIAENDPEVEKECKVSCGPCLDVRCQQISESNTQDPVLEHGENVVVAEDLETKTVATQSSALTDIAVAEPSQSSGFTDNSVTEGTEIGPAVESDLEKYGTMQPRRPPLPKDQKSTFYAEKVKSNLNRYLHQRNSDVDRNVLKGAEVVKSDLRFRYLRQLYSEDSDVFRGTEDADEAPPVKEESVKGDPPSDSSPSSDSPSDSSPSSDSPSDTSSSSGSSVAQLKELLRAQGLDTAST